MEKKGKSKLVRVSPVQHQHLRIMSAYKKQSLMWTINEFIEVEWRKAHSESVKRGIRAANRRRKG